jgi:hypothetical protein
MTSQIVVQEDPLSFIISTHFIIDQISLRQRIVVIQSVHPFRFSEAIVHIFLHIEAVHEDKSWRFAPLEQLLLERITVLSIVDNYFPISCANEPLIVRL